MKDYTIAETYTLPSRGKIYGTGVSETVTLRSMTTAEEQKRLVSRDYPYRTLCEIIDDCTVNDIGISSYDMSIGDYQFLLYKLRTVTYGEEYNMSVTCPYCGCTTTETINLDNLELIDHVDEIPKFLEFDLPKSKKHLTLKVQTPRMLDKIKARVAEDKKRGITRDLTLTYTLAELIDTIDGKKEDIIHVEEWVGQLPMADVNTIISYAEKVNSLLGLDTKLIITCDICGLSYESKLLATKEFFRPALNL